MKKLTMILISLIMLMVGCATVPEPPNWATTPTIYDGNWVWGGSKQVGFYMWFNIKNGYIYGKAGRTSWFDGIHWPIRGKVENDKFEFDYSGHLDISQGFQMYTTNTSRNTITGYLIMDDNKKYTWVMKRSD